MVEPVQGEGGVIVPPVGYLTDVAELCRRYGALFVLDEVQTGLGRRPPVGRRPGIGRARHAAGRQEPLGGVVPVAAMVATCDVYAPFNRDPFLHTSTFAGSPIAVAAADAAVRAITEENVVARARSLGELLLSEIRRAVFEHCAHLVTDVRGIGLLIGVELINEHMTGEFVMELLDRKVIVNHSLNAHRVLRFTPPAVLTDDDVCRLLTAVADAAAALARRFPCPTAELERSA